MVQAVAAADFFQDKAHGGADPVLVLGTSACVASLVLSGPGGQTAAASVEVLEQFTVPSFTDPPPLQTRAPTPPPPKTTSAPGPKANFSATLGPSDRGANFTVRAAHPRPSVVLR